MSHWFLYVRLNSTHLVVYALNNILSIIVSTKWLLIKTFWKTIYVFIAFDKLRLQPTTISFMMEILLLLRKYHHIIWTDSWSYHDLPDIVFHKDMEFWISIRKRFVQDNIRFQLFFNGSAASDMLSYIIRDAVVKSEPLFLRTHWQLWSYCTYLTDSKKENLKERKYHFIYNWWYLSPRTNDRHATSHFVLLASDWSHIFPMIKSSFTILACFQQPLQLPPYPLFLLMFR